MQTSPQQQDKQSRPARIKGITVCVLVCATVALLVLCFTTSLLPILHLALLTMATTGLCALVTWLTWNCEHKGRQRFGVTLAVVLVIAYIIGGFYLWRTVHTVQAITGAVVERSQVSFYVLTDRPIETLDDLADGTIGILHELDRANTDATLQQVESEHGRTLAVSEYESLVYLADALRSGEADAIVLNEAYLSLYEETPGYEEFPAQLKVISTSQVEHMVEQEPKPEQSAEEPVINILISGSDTRAATIDQRGRSDVNIIASINTETHEILLLSTPRDYFVPLDVGVEGAYDKLTHAGIYGMDVLVGTLENLYGIDIDYYFRINFTGFVDIVDALGGVAVYSAYDFTVGDHQYTAGMNQLDGEAALAFARERHAFSEGDRQRGSNQMEVVKAVIEKAMSPTILTRYLTILGGVQSCVDTSVPYSVIADLVREQLESESAWKTESFSVNGSDARSTTYSMNQNLYVMIPDKETVQEAKQKLEEIGNIVAQDEVQAASESRLDDSAESVSEPAV